MILNQYDQVRVISLPERRDRRARMRAELERFGVTPDFFDAIRPADKGRFGSAGFHGSYLSHLAVLGEAQGSILILEDDCTFTREASDYRVPEGTDVWYGGFDDSQGCIIGAHCMGFSARAARLAHEYLSALIEQRIGPAPRAAAEPGYNPLILPPIDGAYVWFRRAHPELVTVFSQIARQRPSRSDCTPGRFDAIPAMRPLVDLGRRVKAAFAG